VTVLTPARPPGRAGRDQRKFLLQRVQPALTGRDQLSGCRQGHDLSPGLKAREATVLTRRRLPHSESAGRRTR
jgi:hypothetical protein